MNSNANANALQHMPTYYLTENTPHGNHTTGPMPRHWCQVAIITAVMPTAIPGHSHGRVMTKAKLFLDLIDQYQLPELTITITDDHTITIRITPCRNSLDYSKTLSQHSNTPSPHQDELFSSDASSAVNGPPKGYITFANTVENTLLATISHAHTVTRKYSNANILNTL